MIRRIDVKDAVRFVNVIGTIALINAIFIYVNFVPSLMNIYMWAIGYLITIWAYYKAYTLMMNVYKKWR